MRYLEGEIRQVVAEYEWNPVDKDGNSYGVKVKIKIYQNDNGRFQASPSRSIQSRGMATSYISINECASVEEALDDCLRGFGACMKSYEDTEWPENESF